MCPICLSAYGTKRFDLHHIDHDKKNDSRENLVFLCINCHNTERHHIEKFKIVLTKINQFMIEEKQKRDAEFLQHLKSILSEILQDSFY